MSETGVICGGSILVDRAKLVSHWPEEETLAVIAEETLQSGGPGLNIAVNLKRLGLELPVSVAGLVGDDQDGAYIRQVCGRYGLDDAALAVTREARTSYTDAFVNSRNGKRTFFHCQGADALLTPDHFDFSQTGASFLHLGSPGIHDRLDAPNGEDASGWVTVLKKARRAGLATNMECISLPPDQLAALCRPCLPHLDSLVINDHEAGALAGVETVNGGRTNIEAVKEAVARLLSMGVKRMVAAHFPLGCVIARPGEAPRFSPSVNVPPGEIVCSVGAGDAFASGLHFGLFEGWPLDRAAALAHAAAAMCLRSFSTNEALGPADACLALADAWGFREQEGD